MVHGHEILVEIKRSGSEDESVMSGFHSNNGEILIGRVHVFCDSKTVLGEN